MFQQKTTTTGARQVYIPIVERSVDVGDGYLVNSYGVRTFLAKDKPRTTSILNRFQYSRRPQLRPEALLNQDQLEDIPVIRLRKPFSMFGRRVNRMAPAPYVLLDPDTNLRWAVAKDYSIDVEQWGGQ